MEVVDEMGEAGSGRGRWEQSGKVNRVISSYNATLEFGNSCLLEADAKRRYVHTLIASPRRH